MVTVLRPPGATSAASSSVVTQASPASGAERDATLAARLEALIGGFLESPRLSAGDPLRGGLEHFRDLALSRRDFKVDRVAQRLDDALRERETNTAECLVYALQGLAVLEAHPRGLQLLGGRAWMLDPGRSGFRAQLQNPGTDPEAYERRRNDFDRQGARDAAWAVLQTLRLL